MNQEFSLGDMVYVNGTNRYDTNFSNKKFDFIKGMIVLESKDSSSWSIVRDYDYMIYFYEDTKNDVKLHSGLTKAFDEIFNDREKLENSIIKLTESKKFNIPYETNKCYWVQKNMLIKEENLENYKEDLKLKKEIFKDLDPFDEEVW